MKLGVLIRGTLIATILHGFNKDIHTSNLKGSDENLFQPLSYSLVQFVYCSYMAFLSGVVGVHPR